MTLADRLADALCDRTDAAPALLTGDTADVMLDAGPAASAAVLIAITERAEPGLLLTQRTDTLRQHAGQIAFPGGRIDPGDADAVAAAVREAEEEIGLPRARVSVVGIVDPYRTITGFVVTPVVAVVPPDLRLSPAAAEVADIFEIPLGFALDPANHRAVSRELRGAVRHYYEIHWQGRLIWGATAGMIVNLSRRLQWA